MTATSQYHPGAHRLKCVITIHFHRSVSEWHCVLHLIPHVQHTQLFHSLQIALVVVSISLLLVHPLCGRRSLASEIHSQNGYVTSKLVASIIIWTIVRLNCAIAVVINFRDSVPAAYLYNAYGQSQSICDPPRENQS